MPRAWSGSSGEEKAQLWSGAAGQASASALLAIREMQMKPQLKAGHLWGLPAAPATWKAKTGR